MSKRAQKGRRKHLVVLHYQDNAIMMSFVGTPPERGSEHDRELRKTCKVGSEMVMVERDVLFFDLAAKSVERLPLKVTWRTLSVTDMDLAEHDTRLILLTGQVYYNGEPKTVEEQEAFKREIAQAEAAAPVMEVLDRMGQLSQVVPRGQAKPN